MGRINELRLIARVAQMYHGEGKRQAEIAEHLHMSQATVSRMLKRAEQEDIVRTTVIPPPGTFTELEAAVRARFGVGEVIVVDCTEDRDGAIMARIGAAPRLLPVQGVAPSEAAKAVMLADPFVRETMELFGRISLAIIGIGAVEPSELLARSGNVFSRQELGAAVDAGAVGDMSLRFFDLRGQPVRTALDARVIGLPFEDLAHIPRVMALAGGAAKTLAIMGALRTGAIDVLVTDRFTAARLAG